ncbi:MAG: hypothetical protein RBS05_22185, partial [Zoogloea oleivorans]|uniref:hypothetical protein n=1 Tax=Zoogloea oleivorans TaxID=1552750 RepID=UPI002A358C9A
TLGILALPRQGKNPQNRLEHKISDTPLIAGSDCFMQPQTSFIHAATKNIGRQTFNAHAATLNIHRPT